MGLLLATALAMMESDPKIIFLSLIFIFISVYNYKRYRTLSLMNKIPGLPSLPFIGNTIEVNVEHEEIFSRVASTRMLWGRKSGICKAWLGTRPYIFISKAAAAEAVLSSSKTIDKSDEYSYLHPWLGQGLLTSTGIKWQNRRKILTPAFHFKILEDFLPIFVEQSSVLTSKLYDRVGRGPFNLYPLITRCTLDIICETAMGRRVNAQNDENSTYVQAVYKIGSIVQSRQAKIWLQPEWAFRLNPLFAEHQSCLEILHSFSNQVIKEKKYEQQNEKISRINDSDAFGTKKRMAFLDLLLQASKEGGGLLSDEDIREEVDTFMFEGHDTTSAAICWLLYLLGCHQDIQEKLHQEILDIFGDSNRTPTTKDLSDLKYLDCCIKEALRLYPSVPVFARKLHSELQIGDSLVPAGTTAMIVAYQLHRDPEQFPNPELFIPERFISRDVMRHPYAYVPFSAGPRNCIGQKFAVMMEKTVISSIIRKFSIKSLQRREDLVLLGELILRPKDGLQVVLKLRN